MPDFDTLAYVVAVAPAIGLSLTPDGAREIAAAMDVVLRVAEPAFAVTLPPELEPAPVFRA